MMPRRATTTFDDGQLLRLEVMRGNVRVVEKLLSAGSVSPNAADELDRTPLLMASIFFRETQRFAMVKSLLKAGADATLADNHGILPLHLASAIGDTGVMEMLLAAAPSTLNMGDVYGASALCYVARKGQNGVVSLLFSAGARDETILSKTGVGCLEIAVGKCAEEGGHEDMVRLILRQGLQAVGGDAVVAKVLVLMAENAQARLMLALLDIEGEDKRQKWARCDWEGMPILHCAALYGCVAAARVLLSNGADETAENPSGMRASDVIGLDSPAERRNDATEAALSRVLQQGPAFRAI